MCKTSAIYCVFPAGNAVVAATEVEEIVDAQWRDLGMPETLWHCRVKEFGPLIVSIDIEGLAAMILSYGFCYVQNIYEKQMWIRLH